MLKQWFPLWTVPALIIFAVGTVWLRLTIIRTTYNIHEVDRGIENARQQSEMLQLKVAALKSPRRLELLARTKFGLAQPKVEQVIRFKNREMGENGERKGSQAIN